ncbi:MAG: F0F1 ATP synthase subunit epsilon [Planctomycetota bacterium]
MTEKVFELRVVTPEGVVFSGPVRSARLPAAMGSMGVLANHAPFASPLEVGEMRVRDDGGQESIYAIGEGFVEIGQNRCVVLTDFRELAGEIDVARATRAAERARKRLAEKSPDVDVVRAEAALQRAAVRLRIGQKHG